MIGGIFALGCSEVRESHYPTVAAAAQDKAFTRGWLPEILQPDTTEIYESHDLDSNVVDGHFRLNDGVLRRIQSDCKSSNVPASALGPLNMTLSGGSAFRCGDFLISVDTAKRTGYFWSKQ